MTLNGDGTTNLAVSGGFSNSGTFTLNGNENVSLGSSTSLGTVVYAGSAGPYHWTRNGHELLQSDLPGYWHLQSECKHYRKWKSYARKRDAQRWLEYDQPLRELVQYRWSVHGFHVDREPCRDRDVYDNGRQHFLPVILHHADQDAELFRWGHSDRYVLHDHGWLFCDRDRQQRRNNDGQWSRSKLDAELPDSERQCKLRQPELFHREPRDGHSEQFGADERAWLVSPNVHNVERRRRHNGLGHGGKLEQWGAIRRGGRGDRPRQFSADPQRKRKRPGLVHRFERHAHHERFQCHVGQLGNDLRPGDAHHERRRGAHQRHSRHR